MQPDFWISRWQEGRTGFHQDAVHDHLLRFGDRFLGGGPHRVLVPLCGKTHDLDWLADQGHEVVGVELSEVAVAAVMERLGGAEADTLGPYSRHRSGRVTMLRGDVLAATPDLVGPVDRIWDRAALVALPPSMRPAYAATLRALLRPGGLLLQNSFSYDQATMDGPPFSVPDDEVATHYPWPTEVLEQTVMTEGKFAARGVESFAVRLALTTKPA